MSTHDPNPPQGGAVVHPRDNMSPPSPQALAAEERRLRRWIDQWYRDRAPGRCARYGSQMLDPVWLEIEATDWGWCSVPLISVAESWRRHGLTRRLLQYLESLRGMRTIMVRNVHSDHLREALARYGYTDLGGGTHWRRDLRSPASWLRGLAMLRSWSRQVSSPGLRAGDVARRD
ncbi:MAG: hypothetical protein HYX75_15130 [Acidobacteria bacterium]|nr:hypothetical protein [Acidobacteriota bacterium]